MQSSRNKRRDMARSILPSRYRSPGKLIQKAKRSNRRDIRAGLRAITHDPDPSNDDWDDHMDFRAYPDVEISWLVRWRRNGDKLNHFEHWAVQVTKEMPIDDRLSYMQSILPAGLIGDHAMSHLRHRPELNPHPSSYYQRVQRFQAAREQRVAQEHQRRELLARALTCALQDGLHKDINTALKQREPDDPEPLVLRHTDAYRFVDELYARGRNGAITHRLTLLRLIAFLDAERYVRESLVLPGTHYAGARYG